MYRGLHFGHPEMKRGRKGLIYPGNVFGTITPSQHNVGGVSADSPFTSWSFDYEVAYTNATDRAGGLGIVLRLPWDGERAGEGWEWVDSPNGYETESEILLRGIRMGAEVVDERTNRNLRASGKTP